MTIIYANDKFRWNNEGIIANVYERKALLLYLLVEFITQLKI